MKHLVLAALLSMLASPLAAAAESDTWIMISDTDSHTYSGKRGSFEISKTKGGTPIGVIRGQKYDKRAKTYTYEQWYISQSDCLNEMGKLVILDSSGVFKFETDFVADGMSAASGIGDLICSLYKQTLEEQRSKGI